MGAGKKEVEQHRNIRDHVQAVGKQVRYDDSIEAREHLMPMAYEHPALWRDLHLSLAYMHMNWTTGGLKRMSWTSLYEGNGQVEGER